MQSHGQAYTGNEAHMDTPMQTIACTYAGMLGYADM